VISDALDHFGERSLANHLSDLDWVSRAAVAHEAVIASFMPQSDAVVPMKLFTLFTNDARALEELRAGWTRVERVIRRLAKRDEWGVRLVFDESRAPADDSAAAVESGRGYLLAKRRQQATAAARTANMRKIAGVVVKALRPLASDTRQRTITAPPETESRSRHAARRRARARAERPRDFARPWRGKQERSLRRGSLCRSPAPAVFVRRQSPMAARKRTAKQPPRSISSSTLAEDATLLDMLDRLPNKGVVVGGDVVLGVAGVDLVYLRLSALLSAVDRQVLRRAAPSVATTADHANCGDPDETPNTHARRSRKEEESQEGSEAGRDALEP
jgi:hypothetical protein